MDLSEFLTRLPKVDIHCHLVGTLRPATLGALARKHQVPLPRPDDALYDLRTSTRSSISCACRQP
jgi:adenosine deaminase